MSSDCYVLTLTELAEINPKRVIRKGTVAPFIEMAALPALSRDIHEGKIVEKEFTGGGARFTNGDTLLARITPCLENGKTALVSCLPSNTNGHGSTEFIVLTPKLVTDRNFLYYLVRSDDFRTYAISRMEGTSGRQRVPNDAISQYSFLCLPDDEREEVGNLLSILDDRITLLRETNATLEAIAQALFKSWFVDFDPVHAKQQGLAPEGMDEATAALFPDSFEESELGLVPRGWRYSSVGQLFKLTMGQSPPGDTYNNLGDGLPFYQGRTDFGFRFPTKRIFCTSPTRLAESGDTLISVRAPVGDVNMAIERCCLGRGVAGVRHPMGYRSFAFYSIRGLHDKFDMHNSEGTVFGSINKKDFETLPVIGPTQGILAAFDDISSPLDNLVIENEEQIRTLTTLRDTLLPRLISGQLRLSEADAS